MTFSDYINYLRDKRIGVIGFGVSNQPLVRVLLRNGCDVTVCDRRERAQLGAAGDEAAAQGAKFALGADYLEHLDFDVIFRTPGVLPIVPQLRKAAQNGDPHLRDGGVLQSLPLPHPCHHRQRRQDHDLDHHGGASACAGIHRAPRRQHRHTAV